MPHNNTIDLKSIAKQTMIDEGFEPDVPPPAQRELQNLPPSPTPALDLRKLLWSSIDNLESRDLDQVEFAERLPDNSIRVMVGIANVDSLVPKGSAIDAHAAANTTSVYTGVTTFPMLPEELSTDKTSLREGTDRSAIVIDFVVAADGSTQIRDIYPALLHNYAKLSYEVVGKWLDDDEAAPEEITRVPQLEQQIGLQLEAALRLRELRKEQGAIELETIQPTAVTDEHGQVVDLTTGERNSARDIIENFMIAANVTMAQFLEQRKVTSIRRVVRTPKDWARIVELAQEQNEQLPEEPDSRALADFLERRRKADAIHFPDLSLAVVKLLGPGEYIAQSPGDSGAGHFGLAVQSYTHSTAPNRRYADLITQRLLKSASKNGGSVYSGDELRQIAEHCTERESAARKVERKMRKVAAAVFLRNRIGEEFRAIVTGVTPKGTFARAFKPPVDGLVVKGQHGLKVGQQVGVRLLATDPAQGYIDFGVVR
jgi:exoribonuclease-2